MSGTTTSTELAALRERSFSREDADAFLAAFADHSGLEPLELDENGALDLVIDGDIALAIVHLPTLPGLVVIAELDEEIRARSDLMRELLHANSSIELTRGGCFARIPPYPGPVFCRLILPEADGFEQFDRELGEFIAAFRAWADALDAALLEESEGEAAPRPPGELPPGTMRV